MGNYCHSCFKGSPKHLNKEQRNKRDNRRVVQVSKCEGDNQQEDYLNLEDFKNKLPFMQSDNLRQKLNFQAQSSSQSDLSPLKFRQQRGLENHMDDLSEINRVQDGGMNGDDKIPMEFDDMTFEHNQCLSICNRNNNMHSFTYQQNNGNDLSSMDMLQSDDKRQVFNRFGVNQNLDRSQQPLNNLHSQDRLISNDFYIPVELKANQSIADVNQREGLLNPENRQSMPANYERSITHGFNQERPFIAYIQQKQLPPQQITSNMQQVKECVCVNGDKPSAICDALNHQTPYFVNAATGAIISREGTQSVFEGGIGGVDLQYRGRESSIVQIQEGMLPQNTQQQVNFIGMNDSSSLFQGNNHKQSEDNRALNLESLDEQIVKESDVNINFQAPTTPTMEQVNNSNIGKIFRPHIGNTQTCNFLQRSLTTQLQTQKQKDQKPSSIVEPIQAQGVFQKQYSTSFIGNTQDQQQQLQQNNISSSQMGLPPLYNQKTLQQYQTGSDNFGRQMTRFKKGLSGSQNDNYSKGSQSQSGDTEFKSAYGGGASVFNAFGRTGGGSPSEYLTAKNLGSKDDYYYQDYFNENNNQDNINQSIHSDTPIKNNNHYGIGENSVCADLVNQLNAGINNNGNQLQYVNIVGGGSSGSGTGAGVGQYDTNANNTGNNNILAAKTGATGGSGFGIVGAVVDNAKANNKKVLGDDDDFENPERHRGGIGEGIFGASPANKGNGANNSQLYHSPDFQNIHII